MRVLHILGTLNPSGAESMLRAAADYHNSQDIQIDILSTGKNCGPFSEALREVGYNIYHIPFSKSPIFFIALFRFIRAHRSQVIHLHTERGNFWFGLVAVLSANKVVRTIHAVFPFQGLLRWRRKIQRHILYRIGVIHIAISESVKMTEARIFDLKTVTIHNWYDSGRLKPPSGSDKLNLRCSLNISQDKFVVITVGNCSAIKNHMAFIKALAQIDYKEIIYLHIGIEQDGNERVLAEQLGISEKVYFLGMQKDIVPYLQVADLYIMPSMHEGFGIAAIEAIACGLPVLLSRVQGLLDFQNEFQGLFYCDTSVESIRQSLCDILALPKNQLNPYQRNNIQTVEQLYGIENGAAKYIHIYKEIG